MPDQDPTSIANAFIRRWETAWNTDGANATGRLYTPDAVLVGAGIGIGRSEIERLLDLLHKQGWVRIAITVIDARAVGGLVLMACEFTAYGCGTIGGEELKGRSSHALVRIGDTWLSAMHSTA